MPPDDLNLYVQPGWYVTLLGEEHDLHTWLRETADLGGSQVIEAPMNQWFLSSPEFLGCADHHAVRGRANELVSELNVRMALRHAALPLKINTVAEMQMDGGLHSFHSLHFDTRFNLNASPVQGRPKRALIALPPEERIRILLAQLAKADDWPSIYDTIELAEKLVPDMRLSTLMGESKRYSRLRGWANSFRHPALDDAPPTEVTMKEARPLLREIVRTALRHIR